MISLTGNGAELTEMTKKHTKLSMAPFDKGQRQFYYKPEWPICFMRDSNKFCVYMHCLPIKFIAFGQLIGSQN